ncbi:hypothetical protein N8569_00815 [bacterium]|jgi:hypothetical protein|nr:hypothetical protein [bacterium]
MGDTYHYNIPGIVIHMIHLIFGVWLAYIGYKKITNQSISDYNYPILIGLGSLVIVYFIHLLYKNWNKKWNYAFGIPNYLIHTIHIINGILLLSVGLKILSMNNLVNMYFIISGSSAALYHLHLLVFKH